ncbi:hypothetical protein BGZ60DRAFT_474365 [Tricladium varicosporioides]|nr:hypothetical protein BGZ60DRAFT_474365 [Hymenoscyphus varicosporioides]
MSGAEGNLQSSSKELLPNGLSDIHRFITTHNQSGEAVFSKEIGPDAKWQKMGDGNHFNFFLGYTTRKFPVSMKPSDDKDESSTPEDIVTYSRDLANPGGLGISSGTVCRFVDFGPDIPAVMHRTTTLDYGVVIEGTMECILDSGEVRIMNRGDVLNQHVCVQRATNHGWKNITPNKGWARMMFVLIGSEAPVISGKTLGEDLGADMPSDVKSSD